MNRPQLFDGGQILESRDERFCIRDSLDVDLEEGYSQFEQEFQEQLRAESQPDMTGVWELATAEAAQTASKLLGTLKTEKPRRYKRGTTAAEKALIRECVSMLREAHRRRIMAERWLQHLHGKKLENQTAKGKA